MSSSFRLGRHRLCVRRFIELGFGCSYASGMTDLIGLLWHNRGESHVSLHWTYLEIACTRLEEARRASSESSAASMYFHNNATSQRFAACTSEAEKMRVFKMFLASQKHHGKKKSNAIIETIVFSALSLEAVINHISKCNLSAFYQKAFDKLELAAKWVVIPHQAFGKGIDPGNDLIHRIDRIQKQRNFLVHARSINWNCESQSSGEDAPSKYRIGVAKGEMAVQTCLDALDEVRKLDPKFDAEQYGYFETWRNLEQGSLPKLSKEFDLWCANEESARPLRPEN